MRLGFLFLACLFLAGCAGTQQTISTPQDTSKVDSEDRLIPSPNYGKRYHEDALYEAAPFYVSIFNDGFVPVKMETASSWKTPARLTNNKPAGIEYEPEYRGSSQRYGFIKLGTEKNNKYFFVFDLVDGLNPILYFDINNNGSLTDSGEVFENQGTGIFAARITIPFKQLTKRVSFSGDFSIWFFTNGSLWKNGQVSHYSQTQLKGSVYLDGNEYLTYLVDRDDNDADFTNDGINIDLNRDGKIDLKEEYFPLTKVAVINDKEYFFRVDW